jgi:LemA protein
MVVAGILVFLVLVGCGILSTVSGTYNSLQSTNQGVKQQWGMVETALQRRFDLVPGLVSSVKGSMKQEQKVFGDIADARTHYAGAAKSDNLSEKVAASAQYESALSRLLVVMENYPELRSNERVADLMTQLEGTENRIATERGRYNESVGAYNALVVRFPSNILAGMFGFKELPYFKSDEGANTAPKFDLTN